MRSLGKNDLWFLLRYILTTSSIPDSSGGFRLDHPWLFERCREIQAKPDGYIDIWAREHFKTTIISFGLSIFDILNDSDSTIGIFSHARPLAKRVLRQIMHEFERNELLKELYSDVLWDNPRGQAPKWSEDDGIIVKRKSNPSACTVEAWGLVDGQPIGKHFRTLVFDDVVTETSVGSPEMIEKTNRAWENATNLGMEGGSSRYIGTRYHYNDTYRLIMERGAAIPRIYPALEPPNAQVGRPVLYTKEYILDKKTKQGPWTFSCQNLCNPIAEDVQGFNIDWLKYYDSDPKEVRLGKNVYICVDPANQKKKHSDYTAMVVFGLGYDQNYYILDIVRERLNLTERTEGLFRLCRKWKEKKEDRIRRLVPACQTRRVYLPARLVKTDRDGKMVNLTKVLENEMEEFPAGQYDDVLDAMSRIVDPSFDPYWPLSDDVDEELDKYLRGRQRRAEAPQGSWMGA